MNDRCRNRRPHRTQCINREFAQLQLHVCYTVAHCFPHYSGRWNSLLPAAQSLILSITIELLFFFILNSNAYRTLVALNEQSVSQCDIIVACYSTANSFIFLLCGRVAGLRWAKNSADGQRIPNDYHSNQLIFNHNINTFSFIFGQTQIPTDRKINYLAFYEARRNDIIPDGMQIHKSHMNACRINLSPRNILLSSKICC